MTNDSLLQVAGTVVPIMATLLTAGWRLAGLITGLGTKVDSLAERVTKLEEHTYASLAERVTKLERNTRRRKA